MAQIVRTVGVDVSKAELVVTSWPERKRLVVKNDSAGWRELSAWLTAEGIERCGFEASGGYERDAATFLADAGHWVSILNPERVKRFRQAQGWRAKNDGIDSEAIALFVAQTENHRFVPDAVRRQLGEWLATRSALVDAWVRLKGMLEHCTDAVAKRLLGGEILRLKHMTRILERRMAAVLAAAPRLAALKRLLTSVVGVGAVTATTTIAHLPELGQLTRRAIASLVGFAPFDDDSGPRHGGRHIEGGRERLRRALYMATLAAIRHDNPVLRSFYRRLRRKGKAAKVALIATARKLLVILNAMVRTGQLWRHASAQA